MRFSLLARLFLLSILVAAAAIAASTWLSAQTTSGSIRQEADVALAKRTEIYRALLGYATRNASWNKVQPLLTQYAQRTGTQITLMTTDKRPIASSEAGPAPLPENNAAVVDPLALDPNLAADATADRIDRHAVGPFALLPEERAALARNADKVAACVRGLIGTGSVVTSPSGRSEVVSPDGVATLECGGKALSMPTLSEQTALAQLNKLVNDCLTAREIKPVTVVLGFSWDQQFERDPYSDQVIQACITQSRRTQLAAYVAPAALLYVAETSSADLSSANELRIAAVGGGVLLLAALVMVLVGNRLIRPLRALTVAAQRMADGDLATRVTVKGRDEIGSLAMAFNEMAASRAKAEQQRRTMVGDVAHELRTPLSNIRGWLEASQDGVAAPDPAVLDMLLEQALQLQHIVDDLQDLAAADAGGLRIHPELIGIRDLLDHVAEAHRPAATAEIVVEASEEDEFTADPVRMRQIVGNLAANAVRHTPAGRITLRGAVDGDWVEISVADTGSGISEEDLASVFDRFWRADQSRTRSTGGAGLGLAIVRKLVEAHGGTVSVASTQGTGTTFTVRLPRVSAA